MNYFELNRIVDRLLFNSLTAKPESSFERNVYDHVSKRTSLNSLENSNGSSILNNKNSKVLGRYEFDQSTKKFVFKSSSQVKES